MSMSLKPIRSLFSNKNYRTKFTYSFVIILVVAAFLLNFVSIIGLLQGSILFAEVVDLGSILFLLAFTFLASLAVTLHFYRVEMYKESKLGRSGIGFVGAFLGFFTSACTVCYPVILTLLGIPAALSILPFGGIEVQIISIVMLLVSIYFVSRSIENCEKCKV